MKKVKLKNVLVLGRRFTSVLKMLFNNKVVKNASWIIACKIAQSILAVIVTMISARYLGPSNYGLISYAASVVSFLSPIALLGLGNVMVQELIDYSEEEGKIIGSSIFMSFLSSLVCIVGVISFSSIANAGEKVTIVVCTLYSIIMLFQAMELIVYWFQARYLSKYSSLVSFFAYLLVSIYKILLLINNMSIYLFALSNAIDYFIISLVLLIIYKCKDGQKICVDITVAKRMLSKSKYYIIPNMMIAIFSQTDRIMLKMMLNDAATGYYSAAVSSATCISFVYLAILDSARPLIFEMKKKSVEKFEISVQLLYAIIFYLSVFIAIGVSIFSKILIAILFGEAYYPAIPVLLAVAWMPTFSYLGSARNIWVLAQNLQKHLWLLNLIGAIVNIVLNFIFIPRWGALGAAITSVITQFITNVIVTIIFKPYRRCGMLLMKGLNIFKTIQAVRLLKSNQKN